MKNILTEQHLRSRKASRRRGSSALLLICIFSAALFLAGCPALWNMEQTEKVASADDLFQKAEDYFQKKDYAKSVETYEQLKSAYPDFKKMPYVLLKIADALYTEGFYDKAIGRYMQFIELYPANKEVPRARYYAAMASFNQIKTTDLDSRIIQKSADAFKAVANDPNAGEWAKKADEKYAECRKKLAGKELDKARTYISLGSYQAARMAAKRVIDEYPNLGYDEEANNLIKKIKNK
jgi:outer membrane protein assembly factor BamD